MRCAARCGQIVAEEQGLPPREGLLQASAFLLRQAAMRAPALGPEQARQDALAIASMRAELGVDADDPDEIDATAKSSVEATA
jgi:glycerol-3-phosphate dehydrogenase